MWSKRLVYIVVSILSLCAVRADAKVGSPGLASTAALDFLGPYGLENFSEHYIDAFSTLIEGKRLMRRGEHGAADELLDRLWAQYPTGDFRWSQLPTRPFGINLGSPPCYYALRMLTESRWGGWQATVCLPDSTGFGRLWRFLRWRSILIDVAGEAQAPCFCLGIVPVPGFCPVPRIVERDQELDDASCVWVRIA
jgi:hypothetical protein